MTALITLVKGKPTDGCYNQGKAVLYRWNSEATAHTVNHIDWKRIVHPAPSLVRLSQVLGWELGSHGTCWGWILAVTGLAGAERIMPIILPRIMPSHLHN